MKNIETIKNNKEGNKITRREAIKRIVVGAGGVVAGANIEKTVAIAYGQEENDKDYYTRDEIRDNYQKHYREGARRRNRIIKEGDRYIGEHGGQKIEIPQKFIDTFFKHLEQAKEAGYYDCLSRDDLGHGHVGLPKEHFEREYKGLNLAEVRQRSLSDPKLMHLYHSRECLRLDSPLNKNRNFLGYFDGRPIKLIHPKKENSSNTVFDYDPEEMMPYDDYIPVPGAIIYFEGHKDGLFQTNNGARLDIDI